MSRRVVVTGSSGITSLGNDCATIYNNMLNKKTGIKCIEEWKTIKGLSSFLAAPVTTFSLPTHYTRKQTRAMGRVAQLATVATETALQQAQLLDRNDILTNGRTGIAYGSCYGSSQAVCDVAEILFHQTTNKITATTYVKMMSHTCAINIALFFGINGRILPTSSACTSGSQAIGYAYETIKHGAQDIMLAGGAEELCPSQTAIFDTLYATTQQNQTPHLTPRPFDQDRDGLVIGEGACTLVLEELSHAQARGATIYAEIVGFGTNCDATHITQPTPDTMQVALELALTDAGLKSSDIGYVCAHGTATEKGDIAESYATHQILGATVPISSLKSYLGHTLGACGAIEAWLSIYMMNQNRFIPTINLDNIDPKCAPLNYLQRELVLNSPYVMSNNFAFEGVNTSLIFHKYT